MGQPEVFAGPILADLIAWGVGGQLFGGVLGYLAAETYNRLVSPAQPRDVVAIATHAAFAAATFCVAVVLSGHLLRVIFP